MLFKNYQLSLYRLCSTHFKLHIYPINTETPKCLKGTKTRIWGLLSKKLLNFQWSVRWFSRCLGRVMTFHLPLVSGSFGTFCQASIGNCTQGESWKAKQGLSGASAGMVWMLSFHWTPPWCSYSTFWWPAVSDMGPKAPITNIELLLISLGRQKGGGKT